MAVLRLISLEADLPSPLDNNWQATTILKGLRRELGSEVFKKDPVTPDLLLRIRAHLKWDSSLDRAVWAACLVMFFCLLRKSNVFPPSLTGFAAHKHLTRRDFIPTSSPLQPGLLVALRWSKTNQYKDRTLVCPLPWLENHPLCPVSALLEVFTRDPSPLRVGPALWHSSGHSWRPLLYGTFLSRFKSLLALAGFNPATFAAHSFRRGGASWGFAQGLPGEIIKSMGDWKSDAYLGYLSFPMETKFQAINTFASHLPTSYV